MPLAQTLYRTIAGGVALVTSFMAGTYINITEVFLSPVNFTYSAIAYQSPNYEIDDYFKKILALKSSTRNIISEMTTEEKAGQLFMPAIEKGVNIDTFSQNLSEFNVGGTMILRSDIASSTLAVSLLARGTELNGTDYSVPGFISIDAEPTLIAYRAPELENILKTSEIDTNVKATETGVSIGEYLYEKGINVAFAPVYDYGSNGTVLKDRMFTGESKEAAVLASVYSEALKANLVVSTAKHFPGHGSVEGDTHTDTQTVTTNNEEELQSFKMAVKAKVPTFMMGHIVMENEFINTNGAPSTISPEAYTYLREELGFKGVVFTDAMTMGALNGYENQSMLALNAGVDIVLMPRNLEEDIQAVTERIKTDKEFEQLVNDKLERIIRLKLVWQWANLHTEE